MKRRDKHRRGYTLLEVLVATSIMAIAVVGLLSNLSTSLSNAARLTDYDRASVLAKRTMDNLMLEPDLVGPICPSNAESNTQVLC